MTGVGVSSNPAYLSMEVEIKRKQLQIIKIHMLALFLYSLKSLFIAPKLRAQC